MNNFEELLLLRVKVYKLAESCAYAYRVSATEGRLALVQLIVEIEEHLSSFCRANGMDDSALYKIDPDYQKFKDEKLREPV